MGTKKYKKFSSAAAAIAKKKGWSMERASAYVATIDRIQNKKPGAKTKGKGTTGMKAKRKRRGGGNNNPKRTFINPKTGKKEIAY